MSVSYLCLLKDTLSYLRLIYILFLGKRGKISDKSQENVDTLQEPDLDTTALASEKAGAEVGYRVFYIDVF